MVQVLWLLLGLLGLTQAMYDSSGNTFIFNAGDCYSSDCSCRSECCDPSSLTNLFDDAYGGGPLSTTVGPTYAPSGLTEDQYIGFPAESDVATATICDHKQNTTAIFMDSFQYNGVLKSCRWLINYDCTDKGAYGRSDPTILPNDYLRIGMFERDTSVDYTFSLLGYITLDRYPWFDAALNNATGLQTNEFIYFDYYFTDTDLAALTVKYKNLSGKYLGISWSMGGVIGYQKYQPAYAGQVNFAIFETEFGEWHNITSLPDTQTTTMGAKQQARHYNMQCRYEPV